MWQAEPDKAPERFGKKRPEFEFGTSYTSTPREDWYVLTTGTAASDQPKRLRTEDRALLAHKLNRSNQFASAQLPAKDHFKGLVVGHSERSPQTADHLYVVGSAVWSSAFEVVREGSVPAIYLSSGLLAVDEMPTSNFLSDEVFSHSAGEGLIWSVRSREDEIRAAILQARKSGLNEIADRIVELEAIQVDEDEDPLQSASVNAFVEHCIGREFKERPAITATPSGEIEATWEGLDGALVIVRFLSDSTMAGYWRKGTNKGTFRGSITDLQSGSLPFTLPKWA